MQTKKNTKSKANTSNLLQDTAVVLLSLLMAAVGIFLFIKNLTETVVRDDKKQVATVTFKRKTVQRKFLDRAVWDRPVQNSPVYNGDTIRTAALGEAKLNFGSNNVVDIGSDTMIQVFVKDNDEAEIGLAEGAVSVRTSSAKMKVNSNNASVTIEENSILHADKADNESLRLIVENGEASVADLSAEQNASFPQSEQKLQKDSIFQKGSEAAITMISPAANVKILNQNTSKGSVPVLFKWHSSVPQHQELILETASSSDFSQNKQTFSVTGLNEIHLEQKSGSVYWRLYPPSQTEVESVYAVGKLTVLPAPPPTLLLPAKEAAYFYKNVPPSIRFLWRGNEIASSYLLEVADNPAMTNPKFKKSVTMESLSVPDLTAGNWYWRVTPHYLTGVENEPTASETFSFKIEERNILPEPEALYPQSIADTANSKSLTFSWKPIAEAKKYRLIVSGNENMANPLVDTMITGNFLELKDAAQLFPNGTYYWAVAGIDESGTVLTESSPKSFKTLDTEIIMRSVFPPDGYTIADTLCSDTRFTWKTNLPGEQHFQVSASRDFSNVTVDIMTANSGADGINLEQGEWYWRVITSIDGSEIKTETKKVIIAPPLDKPKLSGINAGGRIIIVPDEPNTFKWSEVSGADYYQIRIKKPNSDDAIYENLFISKTEVELNLKDIADGFYTISVQGFASPTLNSSRRYGLAEDSTVMLRHLHPVELLSPADNSRIDGMSALLQPGVLRWSSAEKPVNSNIQLIKKGNKNPVLSEGNPGFTVQLPALEAGEYTWRVTALTVEGLDISSKKDFKFSVLPVPPLPAVKFSAPQENAVLNAPFFKTNRTINFSWEPVKDATEYAVAIYNARDKKQPAYQTTVNENTGEEIVLTFKELSLLSRGAFYIEVKAMRRMKDGKLFQDGIVSRLKFEIDLPKNTKIETDEAGVLYGK